MHFARKKVERELMAHRIMVLMMAVSITLKGDGRLVRNIEMRPLMTLRALFLVARTVWINIPPV